MDSLRGFVALGTHHSELIICPTSPSPVRISSLIHLHKLPRKSPRVSVSRSSLSGSELAGDDIMQFFIKERQINGDFISKISDVLWRRDGLNLTDVEVDAVDESTQSFEAWQNDSERRKRINLLKYDALKRELFLLTTGVGAACTGYCLITLSVQAALSYAVGVGFSCLYLWLLFHHSDNISKEAVPQIFLHKKSKKIGIRSEDLKTAFERTVNGSLMALSSPRLVIPAAIYGFWGLSHHFSDGAFDFQLVPAMFGLFAYKAACLIQVYRDNEDLRFVFPENEENSSN